MARLPGWIRIVDEGRRGDHYAIELRLSRFWWAHLSFWTFFFRGER